MILAPARQQILASLEGLISEQAGLRLTALAATVPSTHAIVEIGSYKGKSTCYLAEGARMRGGAGVYAIDPWELPGNVPGRFGFDTAREGFDKQVEYAGLDNWITPVTAFSRVASSAWVRGTGGRPIGMIFIDGSHEYADVRDDLEGWYPHLDAGGIIVFDDYQTPKNPGVTRAVDELQRQELLEDWDFETPPLAIAYKPASL